MLTFLKSKLTKFRVSHVSCLHYEVQIFQLNTQNSLVSFPCTILFHPFPLLPNFHSSHTEKAAIPFHLYCPSMSPNVCIFFTQLSFFGIPSLPAVRALHSCKMKHTKSLLLCHVSKVLCLLCLLHYFLNLLTLSCPQP